jgi:hypothetical protein
MDRAVITGANSEYQNIADLEGTPIGSGSENAVSRDGQLGCILVIPDRVRSPDTFSRLRYCDSMGTGTGTININSTPPFLEHHHV